MTCAECRHLLHTDPESMSRAQRATVFKHLFDCSSCPAYLMQQCAGLSISRADIVASDALFDQDSVDPEFMAVIRPARDRFARKQGLK